MMSTLSIPVRCIIWISSSYYLAPNIKVFLKYYFTLDNLTLLMLLSFISYIVLNSSDIPEDVWKTCAVIEFFFLFFCLNGNFRMMCKYMVWYKRRVIIYKINRIYGCCSYMIFGSITILHPSPNLDSDLYLLYVFTALAYFS